MKNAKALLKTLPPDRELQFTTKAMLALVWPILIEQGLNTTIGIVNSMMVGQLGMHAISAVSLVDQVNMLFFNLFNAFAAGVTVVVSHRMGRKDRAGADDALTQSFCLVLAFAAVLGAVLLAFNRPALRLIFGAVDENVMAACRIYLIGSALSYPLMAAFSVCAGALRATGDSRTPMVAALVSNIVNVAVGALTIFVLQFGVTGASCAVFFARLAAAGIVFWRIVSGRCGVHITRFTLKIKKDAIAPIFEVGIPAGIDSLIFNGGKILVASFISSMGTSVIAANSILNNLLGFSAVPGNAFSTAGVTITGRCYGARSYREARRHLRVIPLVSTVVYGLMVTVLWLMLPMLLKIYNADAQACEHVYRVFRLLAVFGTITWSYSFVLPNCLRGVGDIRFNTVVSVASMWIFRVALAYLLGVVLKMQLVGVWTAMLCDWGFREICYIARMCSDRWLIRAVAHDNALALAENQKSRAV